MIYTFFLFCVYFNFHFGFFYNAMERFHSSGQHLCKVFGTEENVLYEKRIQLPQESFGTRPWPPFHCFGTPIWLPWRHVKTILFLRSRKVYVNWWAYYVTLGKMIRIKKEWIKLEFLKFHACVWPFRCYGFCYGCFLPFSSIFFLPILCFNKQSPMSRSLLFLFKNFCIFAHFIKETDRLF